MHIEAYPVFQGIQSLSFFYSHITLPKIKIKHPPNHHEIHNIKAKAATTAQTAMPNALFTLLAAPVKVSIGAGAVLPAVFVKTGATGALVPVPTGTDDTGAVPTTRPPPEARETG
jgi:hypothetical protein